MGRKNLLVWLAIFFVLININACAKTKKVWTFINPPPPETQKIPIKVGLFLSRDFCNYIIYLQVANFQIGETLCKGSKKMLDYTFKEVVIVSDQVQDRELFEKGIKAIVIPTLVSVKCNNIINVFQDFKVDVSVKYSIFDLEAKIIWEETFTGKGIGRLERFREVRDKYLEMAIRDQFSRAMGEILSLREIRFFREGAPK